jgi:hypothetical protein
MVLIGSHTFTQPVVEVRTPTYRRPVLLKRALQSLIAQSYPHWRCIVLDDEPGGGEGRDVCGALGDPRIVYRANEKNLGVGRNIDHAFSMQPLPNATHACVLEDDNYFLPDLIQSNLAMMRDHATDLVLRNQLVERPKLGERDGRVGPSTTYDGQYISGVLGRKELWASFFYSTGANNSSLFWRLNQGLSFSTCELTEDPVFQERLRTLCIDRDVYVAMEPLIVWRDNGPDSYRPKTASFLSFALSQAKAAARERRLYQLLYAYLKEGELLELAFDPKHRTFDRGCARVFSRCGIPTPNWALLSVKERLRIAVLRLLATCLAAPIAEPVKYQLGGKRIEALSPGAVPDPMAN